MSCCGIFSFIPNPVEKMCSKAYAGPEVVTVLMAQSLQQTCNFSADSLNGCSE